MRFVDEVKIQVRAGNGGHGASSFQKSRNSPFGGPDGGDGGKGGDVILEARLDTSTLIDLHYVQRYAAKNGEPGQSARWTGRNGADVVISVPVGTMVYRYDNREFIGDLTSAGQRLVVARGGLGGHGNLFFTTNTNRAPVKCEEGGEGEALDLWLELKLIADVGLLGYPNAGKSTLISRVSAARPKIADYPFTTLIPNLGVVRVGDDRSFVIADVPGLIEGASQGAGLGLKFLRHIERTRAFLHLVSVSGLEAESPETRFDKICRELALYDEALARRPQWVVLTQLDTLEDREAQLPPLLEAFQARGLTTFAISAVTGEGVRELMYAVGDWLRRLDQPPEE